MILYNILIALEAIVCLLLIGIVLLQKSTGDGNGLSFGGGAESVFGAQTGNVLTRGTVVLAIVFLVNTLVLSCLGGSKGIRGTAQSRAEKIAAEEQAAQAAAVGASAEAEDLLSGGELLPAEPAPEAPAAEPAPVEAAPAPVEAPAAPAEAPAAEPAPAPAE